MALDDDFKALLSADGTLATLMTGGIYTVGDLGLLRRQRDRTAPIYDADGGFLKPHIIINSRDEIAFRGIQDTVERFTSTRQIIEVWFYDDGDAGYSTITSARERAFDLLHGHGFSASDTKALWLLDRIKQRDDLVERACYERSDYECYRIRS